MDKDTLIAQQALELAELKERLYALEDRMSSIRMQCTGIGGPLNDNKLAYSPKQLGPFNRIHQLATSQ